MDLINVIALICCTFGIYAYGAILFNTLRPNRPPGEFEDEGAHPRLEICGLAIYAVSLLWFVVNVLGVLSEVMDAIPSRPVQSIAFYVGICFPPLIMNIAYLESRVWEDRRRRLRWRLPVIAVYAAILAEMVWVTLLITDRIPAPRYAGAWIGLSFGLWFCIAGAYAILVARTRPEQTQTERERAYQAWQRRLLQWMILVTVLMTIVLSFNLQEIGRVIRLAVSLMPLVFLFVGTVTSDRFEFFDLFIKRGLALLLTIGLLTAYLGLVLPLLDGVAAGWTAAFVYALALLPVAMSLPWAYRRLGDGLDQAWLGRQWPTVDAMLHFQRRLRDATTLERLRERAEEGLAEIFHAPARVAFGSPAEVPGDFVSARRTPIPAGDSVVGSIWLGPRANDTPYFSEDGKLLDSLAGVLGHLHEQIALQREQLEQERRQRELTLQASRSELKALRAQINPHFLFNALNVIAGLIHRDPARADATVEQLAEVFRYTLRGSRKEWARLEDELEFAEAYLAVERARFGDRLQTRIESDPADGSIEVPTMMVQTLVENAVKHGIANVRREARIEVVARREGDRIVIHVRDNGPGIDPETLPASAGERSGFGLHSIRERLQGHFGGRGELRVGRDEATGMTDVALAIPLARSRRDDVESA